jgi:NADH-quinone oxidoreductase subunit C
MFGVEFAGHPDPRKLLLPDDLDGHPLRKDFSHPNLVRLPEVP